MINIILRPLYPREITMVEDDRSERTRANGLSTDSDTAKESERPPHIILTSVVKLFFQQIEQYAFGPTNEPQLDKHFEVKGPIANLKVGKATAQNKKIFYAVFHRKPIPRAWKHSSVICILSPVRIRAAHVLTN
jgi:hypothetical protein